MADGLLNKASIILTPTGYKAGTLYNVAPVVEPYEDFDFARASVASRVNSSGLVEMVGRTLSSELVTCGDFSCADPNDYWTIENTWTFGSGVANGNGANGSSEQLVQSNVTTIGKTYLVSYEILNYVSGSLFLPNVGSVKSGNGIHTEYITATQTDLKVTGINFNGSITNVSVKEVIDTNNIPRISYDSNGENGHILLEPTTTNLYLNTDTLSTQNVSTSASEYSVSFYGTGTITFSGSYSGSLVGTGVNDRVSLTFSATSGTLTSTVSGSVTNAQIENLGYSTSYMPSLSTQGVRATETANGAGSADLINSTEGVLYAEIAALADDLTNRQMTLSDGSDNNRIVLKYDNQSNVIQAFNRVGGVETAFLSASVTDIKLFSKCALKYKVNDYALWIDGIEVATDTSSTTFSSSTLNDFKFGDSGGSSNFYGKCKALAVFNEALSDAELNNLTG